MEARFNRRASLGVTVALGCAGESCVYNISVFTLHFRFLCWHGLSLFLLHCIASNGELDGFFQKRRKRFLD